MAVWATGDVSWDYQSLIPLLAPYDRVSWNIGRKVGAKRALKPRQI